MKKIGSIITLVLLACMPVVAHDFEVKNEAGVSIWYNNVTASYGSNAVEVAFEGTWYDAFQDEYRGTVVIPNSISIGGTTYVVVGIGEQAFSRCFSLKNVTIPESIEYIKDKAFEACCHLQTVNYNAVRCNDFTLPSYAPFSFNNVAYGEYIYPDDDPDYPDTYWSAYDLRTINIGASVERIPDYMFYGMGGSLAQADYTVRPIDITYSKEGVTKINFLGVPQSIGVQAFRSCRLLETIIIPDGVQTLGQGLFADCDTLREATLPDKMEEMPAYFFANCKELQTVNFPSKLRHINFEAFKNCQKLTDLSNLPASLRVIGPSAFRSCENITTVVLPSGLDKIDGYAFSDCTALEEIVIPDAVYSIGNYAFEDCTHLKEVTLGSGTKLIGDFVFAGCMQLSNGVVHAPRQMVAIQSNTFFGVDDTMRVEVEGDNTAEYAADANWARFFPKNETLEDQVEEAILNPAKKIRNGQLVIERNGQEYTVTGQRLTR